MSTQIYWIDQQEAMDAGLTGGKAANLARLWNTGRVPPGFVLAAPALAAWRPGERLAENLVRQVTEAYAELARRCGQTDPPVAVRSSAVDEDGQKASFAGQYETILNVSGMEALLQAVTTCLGSAASERARAYREQFTGSPLDAQSEPGGAKLAVLVQQMVPAARSAVAFSANPVSGAAGEVVVELVTGLGEGLVSGQVTPERFLIPKAHLARPEAGGTPQPYSQEALAAARLALDLEQRLGHAVDIECAFDARGQLFLLQCRPVTALGSAPQPAAAEPAAFQTPADGAVTWTLGRQAFPDPLTPLVRSYLPYHLQGWRRDSHRWGTAGTIRLRFYHGYYYTVWEPAGLTTWEDYDLRLREAERTLRQRWEEEYLPRLRADHARVRALPLPHLLDADLSLALEETLTDQVEHYTIHAHLATMPYSSAGRLVNWYLERFPEAPESEPYRLIQGLPNTSVSHGHALWQLSQQLTPPAAQALRDGDWAALPEPFRAAWLAYLAEYGHRTMRMADPMSPTWEEDPSAPARLVLDYAQRSAPDPLIEQRRLAEDREAFTAEVRARLNSEEKAIFEDLLSTALESYALTEDHSFWIDQQSPADLRLLVREFTRRLLERGAVDAPGDVAFLTLHELILWGFGLADPLRPLIQQRKEEHAANLRFNPPETLGPPPQPVDWVDRFSGPAAPLQAEPGTLRGVGASAGSARGRARVVRTLEEARALQPGEILVCVSTDVNWTPFFAIAAGLVTDTGGSLAHAAVVAREYRLPAVVGTIVGTTRIQTGQVIAVDGLAGVITLHPSGAESG